MAIETDLSVAPYFDEAEAGLEKNYYKILFKPSVPVQVRELNELQTILQRQIEEFGDNVLKKGTIIRGCTFSFYNRYPYVKIKDSQVDGAPVNVSALVGKTIVSSTNHKALILDYADGFESTDPDTKTLYLRYLNSGESGSNTSFIDGDQLTVQDPAYSISNVTIALAGTGYSNSDSVVFTSAIAVQSIQGTIVVGSTLTQPATGANSVVISVDTATYPDKAIIKLRPLADDLSDSTKTANNWTFSAAESIMSLTNSAVTATVTEVIGAGASAVVTTDTTSRVTDISMIAGGSGYYIPPYATVRSTAGGAGVSLAAQNYSSKITVYDGGANNVGYGYGFGVSEGVVYQKGYFLNVPEQTVIVSKYDRFPNNLSVGFTTVENIVDAYEDTSLLDNALGTRNYTAPGADRLQLTPKLEVVNTDIAKANLEFFSLVEFSDGVPYKQNQRTAYNGIVDEMAIRTSESAGDYVTDKFMVAVKSTANSSLRANSFTVVVDPGTGYIDGYRVKTYGNYQFTLDKGIDTAIRPTANTSADFGSYVRVNNLAGTFDFSGISTVKLYDSQTHWANSAAAYSSGTITPTGNQIGTAKLRSVMYDSGGEPGTAEAVYNMYIFDIQMTPGYTFSQIGSIYYDGSVKGIADAVYNQSSTGASVVLLNDTLSTDKKTLDKMLFYSGFDSPLAINNISYTYRTFDDNGLYTISNTGVMSISLSGNETFPYNTGAELSSDQKRTVLVTPLTSLYANASADGGSGNPAVAGYASITAGSNTITSSNGSFTSTLRVGDYIKIGSNSTAGFELRKITKINSGTSIQIDAAASAGMTNSTGTVIRAFPAYIPLPLSSRSGVSVTNSLDGQTLTVNLGTRLAGACTSITVGAAFNVAVANAQPAKKSANRDLFVKILPANNTTGFGYSEYGSGVDGYFNASSNVISNTTTAAFTAGQTLKIVKNGSSFVGTVGTITNSTYMQLTTTVNFTGNADIYPAVNLNGPWCLGVADIFRLKNVFMANTSTVNVNSTNVTRDFVIDHNHNTNYADLGYLVKKKSSSLVIGPQDYLLVQFDAFTRDYNDRIVHINSYVSSNSAVRFETDAKTLSALNNSLINTVEIPEIHSSAGTDYDMIGYFDFRPAAANTANLSTSVATATLNPNYTVAFPGGNKKLPVPGSNMSYTAEYFLGRIDTVYMGTDGRIGTARGHAYDTKILDTTTPDDLLTPVPKGSTMVLNNIKVPSYPSIEENANYSLASVLNKGVINDVALTRRTKSRNITRLLTKQQIEMDQPRRYSMQDIGNLERRIKDLEYYVSLSNLELSVKDLNLPSSQAPNINRFKFGFFADAFDDTTYSDIDSIEYAASIEEKRVIPSYETIKIEIPSGECPYNDYSVVSQLKATGNALPICVGTAHVQVTQGGEVKKNGERIKSTYLTMASSLGSASGLVKVYCYFYTGADVMRIYQSTTADNFPATPILTTSASTPLTTADIGYLQGLPDGFFSVSGINNASVQLGKHIKVNSPANGLRFAGKIQFNHNPANGRFYRIDVANHSIIWRYRIEYPINVACGPVDNGGGGPPSYKGTLKVIGINTVKLGGNNDNYTSYYKIHLVGTGFKPSSLHKLYFAGKDMSHLVDTSIRDSVPPIPPIFNAGVNGTWQELASKIPDYYNDAPNGYVMTDAGGRIEMYLYALSEEVRTNTTTNYPQHFNSHGQNGEDPYRITKTTERFGSELDKVVKPVIELYNADKSSYGHVTANYTFQLFSGFRKISSKTTPLGNWTGPTGNNH